MLQSDQSFQDTPEQLCSIAGTAPKQRKRISQLSKAAQIEHIDNFIYKKNKMSSHSLYQEDPIPIEESFASVFSKDTYHRSLLLGE